LKPLPPITIEKTLKLRYAVRSKSVPGKFEPLENRKEFDWPIDEADEVFQFNLEAFLEAREDAEDGNLFLICPCEKRLKLRRPTKLCPRIVVERMRGARHECGRKVSSWDRHEPPLNDAGDKRPLYDFEDIPIRLVLTSQSQGADKFERSEHMRAFTERGPILSKNLGGLLAHMADVSGLTQWEPGRAFGLGPREILMRMNSESWKRPALERGFRPKTVFAPLVSNLKQEIKEAIQYKGGTVRNLSGKALLINAQLDLNPGDNGLEIVFEGSNLYKWVAKAPEVQNLLNPETRIEAWDPEALQSWEMLKYPKAHPKDASLLFIALLERVKELGSPEFFRIPEMAWRLMDNRGVLYESTYEFEAGAQLFRAGIRHWKPAGQFFEVNDTTRKPDFLVWDRGGMRHVIEVDPGDGDSDRKVLRNIDFEAGKVSWFAWNPLKEPNLIDWLRKEGFKW
jgi:hypothetical protein